jgi:hypothetical protein
MDQKDKTNLLTVLDVFCDSESSLSAAVINVTFLFCEIEGEALDVLISL